MRKRWTQSLMTVGSALFFAVHAAAAAIGSQEPEEAASPYAARLKAKAESLGYVMEYDTPPKPKKTSPPKYPDSAFKACQDGTVTLLIAIDAEGRVIQPEVLESRPGLDEAALECVKSWRFKPARKGGNAVGTVAIAPVRFAILDHYGARVDCSKRHAAKGPSDGPK